MGYLTNFIVYTLAMAGVIMLAVLTLKITTTPSKKGSSKFLQVQETLSLSPRKTLYVISAGDEKFLIAGDADRTSLISKLDCKDKVEIRPQVQENFKETMENLSVKSSYIDRSVVGIYKTQNKPYDSVMKNLAERIKEVSM